MTTNPEAGMRLKPCPHCGADLVKSEQFSTRRSAIFVHEPTGCFCDGVIITDKSTERAAAWNTRAAAPVTPAGTDGETGWLIESWNSKTGEFGATWWSLDDSLEDAQGWTKDSTIALRFSREADAQAYIDNTAWTEAKPTEHRWHDALAARAQPQGGEGEMGGGDVIATVDASRWDHPTAPQLAYANGWNDRHAHPAEPAARDGGEGLRVAADDLANGFAWSAVRADCEEARENLQGLIDGLRDALAASGEK